MNKSKKLKIFVVSTVIVLLLSIITFVVIKYAYGEKQNQDCLQVGIRSLKIAQSNVSFVWRVENVGEEPITISDNNSAVVKVNNRLLELHSPEVVLSAGQSCDIEVSIPITYFWADRFNALKVTAVTENGTSASAKTTILVPT